MSARDYIAVPKHPRLRMRAFPSAGGLVVLWYLGRASVSSRRNRSVSQVAAALNSPKPVRPP